MTRFVNADDDELERVEDDFQVRDIPQYSDDDDVHASYDDDGSLICCRVDTRRPTDQRAKEGMACWL